MNDKIEKYKRCLSLSPNERFARGWEVSAIVEDLIDALQKISDFYPIEIIEVSITMWPKDTV